MPHQASYGGRDCLKTYVLCEFSKLQFLAQKCGCFLAFAQGCLKKPAQRVKNLLQVAKYLED